MIVWGESMRHVLAKPWLRDGCIGLVLLLAAAGLVTWPVQVSQAVKNSLLLCGNVIIPSLFPFFLLSSLVIDLGLARYLGRLLEPVMQPLFHVNGSCATALALGAVGGYPIGARTAIQLYQNKQCSCAEAERLLAFCNNCGPAFILGVVGAGIFGNQKVGLLLYAVHLTASMVVGLIFRFYRPHEQSETFSDSAPHFRTVSFSSAFTGAVAAALQSCLNISAFIICFSVLLSLLSLSGLMTVGTSLLAWLLSPLGFDPAWANQLVMGLLEMSSGVSSLAQGPVDGRLSMAAFMLGWAGVSVHCQVIAFMGDSGLSINTYLVGKLLHGILSALLTVPFSRIISQSLPASSYLAEQVETIAHLEFHQALALSTVAAWLFWLFFLGAALWISKKTVAK